MQKVILDTDILSEYLKDYDPNVARHADNYAPTHTRFTFTSVTAYEMAFGLEAKGAIRQLESLLERIDGQDQILPIEEDYLTAARIKGRARRQGDTVELPDCLIAAVASRLGLPLVTGNWADYMAITRAGLNLSLMDWRKA